MGRLFLTLDPGSEDIDWRQNGRFYDQSGQPMWGFEQWGFEW
jgi:hypothetical protein